MYQTFAVPRKGIVIVFVLIKALYGWAHLLRYFEKTVCSINVVLYCRYCTFVFKDDLKIVCCYISGRVKRKNAKKGTGGDEEEDED